MNNLLEECKKYDLIGIGELTHGELTSWKYRYKIKLLFFAKHLIHIFIILILKKQNLIFIIIKIQRILIVNFIHRWQ